MNTIVRSLITFAALTALALPAWAQSGQPFGAPAQPSEQPSEQPDDQQSEPASSSPGGMTTPGVEKTAEPPFHAGDIDIIIGGGLGGLAYPHIEPSVDIGIVPLTDDFSISVGGGVDFGWCLLCAALDAVSPNLDFASTYVKPFGRVLVHAGTLGGLLSGLSSDFTIDLYGGLMGGPSFYSFTITEENTANPAVYDYSRTSVVLGPVVGGRLGFADNTFFVSLDYRFLAELGADSISVTDSAGNEVVYDNTAFSQQGSDFLLGIGLRI